MAGRSTPVLLVTANVGSIFEDPSHMLKIWTEEFLSTVARLDPKFIALHCQEVGGKNYERSMKHVEDFVRLFMSSEELRLFDKVRVFLDEDYSSAENFTALGNFYFIHESLSDVLIWDFAAMTFVSAKGKEVHSGNIEAVTTKEKSKFPQDFFPECKWSRKGFLRTRWSLNGTVLDLINIHLFHDASNFIAMESFPSVYCKNRRRALEHTLERFHNDSYGTAPFFVFGDFNFRTDTQGVINKLVDGLSPVRVQSNKSNDHTKLQYKDDASQVVLSLGKKEFSHVDHQSVFLVENGTWLKEYDRELEAFSGRLFEFAIAFPPSYPFEEEEKGGNNYMKTRCPAWCDRVILSNTAKNLVNNVSDANSVEYGLMGPNTRMGDHKPVYLKMDLIIDAGTVSCCTSCDSSSSDKRVLCFGNVAVCEPASWSCSSLSLKQGGSAPSSALTLRLDTSAAALAADCFLAPPHASLLHEPYTPESMETPSSSPVPVRIQRDFAEIENVEWKCGGDDDEEDNDDNDNENGIAGTIPDPSIAEESRSNEKEELKIIEDLNSMNAASVCYLENSSQSKNNPSSEIDNNSCQNKTGHQDVPHVFVCYSDIQESYSYDVASTEKSNFKPVAVHLDGDSLVVMNHEEQHQSKSFPEVPYEVQDNTNSSAFKSRDQVLQEASDKLSFMSSHSVPFEVCEKKEIIERKLATLLSQKTLSLDSGILRTLSSTSVSSPSTKSMKDESFETNVETFVETSDGVKEKNDCIIVPSELKRSEDSGITCQSSNENRHRILELTISSDKIARSASVSTKNYDYPDQSTSSCSETITCSESLGKDNSVIFPVHFSEPIVNVVVNPSKNSILDEKSDFPITSQDCISIVSTEMSSQLKGTKKEEAEHAKNTKLKPSSKKACSSCCAII